MTYEPAVLDFLWHLVDSSGAAGEKRYANSTAFSVDYHTFASNRFEFFNEDLPIFGCPDVDNSQATAYAKYLSNMSAARPFSKLVGGRNSQAPIIVDRRAASRYKVVRLDKLEPWLQATIISCSTYLMCTSTRPKSWMTP